MSTKQSPIQKLGITAKTLRWAGLALVCSGFITLGLRLSIIRQITFKAQ